MADVSIETVAKLAGVSKATVSRVLNKRDSVHPRTLRAVEDALTQANYVVRGRSRLLSKSGDLPVLKAFALIVPEIASGLSGSLQRGLVSEASTLHHQVIICNSDNSIHKQGDEILQLIHKRVAGVAVVTVTSAPTPIHHIELLQRCGIPVVLLHRDVPDTETPVIRLPLEQAGYEAGRALIAKGHRRIVLVTGMEASSSRLHEEGLTRALREAGAELPQQFVYRVKGYAPLSMPDMEAAVVEMLRELQALPLAERPTALFATFDSIAEVIYMCLMRTGLRIPDDMSLMGFGSQQRDGAVINRLNSVVVDEFRVGVQAAQFLSQMAQGVRPIASRQIIEMPLSISSGETFGAVMQVNASARNFAQQNATFTSE